MLRTHPARLAIRPAIGVLLAFVLLEATAVGQLRTIPSTTYYGGINALYRGDYRNAEQQFQRELRGAIKSPQSRWIDSICYYAMLGETYFLTSQNAEALEQFNNAAKLYLAFPQWMLRVDFPNITADANRARTDAPPWGRSQRNATLGRFPDRMSIQQGQFVTEEQLLQGGVFTQPQIWPVNVSEVVRCTALAIRRRNQLLGPLAPHDDLSVQLANQLRRGGAPPNHWSTAWLDIELGLAETGLDRIGEAQRNLSRSIVVLGQFDHPLTGVALLEQGRLMLKSDQYQAAAKLLEEASYAAYYFDDPGVVDEALALGLEAHILSGANGVYPPLEVAAAWAQRENWRHIQAHMLLLLAESLSANGQYETADALLKTEVPRVLTRRNLQRGRLLAKYRYLTALVSYQLNRPQPAVEALQEAIAFQSASSLWNFQIALANQMFDARRLTGRTARDLYTALLRDPEPADWSQRPMESLGVLSLPHVESYDRWFLATLDQREAESALAVADMAHRRRFLSSLPLGGRMLALAHILEAPDAALPQPALLQRQDLLVRMPTYQDLARDAVRIRRELAQGPLVPVDEAARKAQSQQLAKLAASSLARDVLLRGVALTRQASDITFPPALSAPELQAQLEPGAVLVLYHQIQGRIYGFAITRSQYTSWQVGPVNRVQTAVAHFLRLIGNHDPNRQVDPDMLADQKWRTAAAELHAMLLAEAQLDLSQTTELIIVPDHVVWYAPFEALVENSDPQTEPFIARIKLRYCPLAGLAVGDPRSSPRVARTGVVVGQMFPRADVAVAEAEFDRITQVVPTAEQLTDPLAGPAPIVATLMDELIVLSEIELPATGSPYGWAPLRVGRNGGGDTLADWLVLPAAGPQTVILPGFQTPAGEALRGVARIGRPGDDLFAATCGLMAAGAKRVLISRWRTGGKTAFDFAREFAQELPHSSAMEAWQRSVLLIRASTLDVAGEPRIERLEGVDAPPAASHPFFWAGYLLASTGADANAADPNAPAGAAANDAP